ncbi:MAG: asparaginase domain-containing protein [Myxococcota bacterium]
MFRRDEAEGRPGRRFSDWRPGGPWRMLRAVKSVALVSTGGTIEKTYDALTGVLANDVSILDVMLAGLELRGAEFDRIHLMNKDSLEMTDADHDLIADTAHHAAQRHDGVVIVHGTDRLEMSGERILARGLPPVPVVLTGAMRPYELRTTDALQNLVEALTAVQLLQAGVYASMHNRVMKFPGVVKDRRRGTLVPLEEKL